MQKSVLAKIIAACFVIYLLICATFSVGVAGLFIGSRVWRYLGIKPISFILRTFLIPKTKDIETCYQNPETYCGQLSRTPMVTVGFDNMGMCGREILDFMLTGVCATLEEQTLNEIKFAKIFHVYQLMKVAQPLRRGFKDLCQMFPQDQYGFTYIDEHRMRISNTLELGCDTNDVGE